MRFTRARPPLTLALSALAFVSACSSGESGGADDNAAGETGSPTVAGGSSGGLAANEGGSGGVAVSGSGGAEQSAGEAGQGGSAGEAIVYDPYSLLLDLPVDVTPCGFSEDREQLWLPLRNDGPNPSAPTQLTIATMGGPSVAVEVPELAVDEGTVLKLSRASLGGALDDWNFELSFAGDETGTVVSLADTCPDDLRPRAAAGIAVLQGYYDQGSGLYNGNEWWRGANMLEVLIEYSRATGDAAYLSTLDNTFEKNKGGNFINEYYDDMGWWALAWIRAYDVTHDEKYLNMAKTLFTDMTGGWTEECGGGVYWKKGATGKASIANELFLTVAARLHLRTPGDSGPGSYLDWAQREWDWFSSSDLLRDNHQIVDNLDPATCLSGWDATFTYNQGVILGGLTDLWRATGDDTLIETAVAIADATIELQSNAEGVFVEAACDPNCSGDGDGVQFKGVFPRNVAYLYAAYPLPRLRQFLIEQSDFIWNSSRSENDEFGLNWEGPFDHADPSRQSSALDAILGAVRSARMNLALSAVAEGTAGCSATEGPERAIDGNGASKWCAAGAGDQSLVVDLGASQSVVGFVVAHAEHGGEDAAWNTKAFEIALSDDGATWSDVVTVTGNTAGSTQHPIVATAARYARLHVSEAQSSTDIPAARIHEFEVRGVSLVDGN